MYTLYLPLHTETPPPPRGIVQSLLWVCAGPTQGRRRGSGNRSSPGPFSFPPGPKRIVNRLLAPIVSELSEGAGETFGRHPLFNTAISQELLDCSRSKAHNFKERVGRRDEGAVTEFLECIQNDLSDGCRD